MPHILNITEALQGIATNLVEGASLPPWDEFQKVLAELGPRIDLLTAGFDNHLLAAEPESRGSNSNLTTHDVRILLSGQQLNEAIVNCTLQLLSSQGLTQTPDAEESFYIWNSSLFLDIAAQEDVGLWKSKAGMKSLYDYNFHLIPIYLNARWMLAKVDLRRRVITIFDSTTQIGIEQSLFTDLQRWADEDMAVSDFKAQSPFHYVISEVCILSSLYSLFSVSSYLLMSTGNTKTEEWV